MVRPVKVRTAETYRRDIENLSRLRSAIRLDVSIESDDQKAICEKIDNLTDDLDRLMRRDTRPANS